MNKDLKILIVDDEEAYCDVLGMILQTEGYQVKQCTRSKEVIDILRNEDFDLIISDLIMPEMDGVALLKAVKKSCPNLYFIMLTAYGTIENAVNAMKLGAYTYAIKGSDPEELLKEIRTVFFNGLQKSNPIHFRHDKVRYYKVKVLVFQDIDYFFRSSAQLHLISFRLQDHSQDIAVRCFIVDYKNFQILIHEIHLLS
jgi:DNA-binding NtrC family response regulator